MIVLLVTEETFSFKMAESDELVTFVHVIEPSPLSETVAVIAISFPLHTVVGDAVRLVIFGIG